MAVINPFPEDRIRDFVARTTSTNRYLFALLNAQRAVAMAEVVIGGYVESDRILVDATLEQCWATARSSAASRGLRDRMVLLYDRMVPDQDGEFTPYDCSFNSALAGLVYAIESIDAADRLESAYSSASSMFDLADYLLQRDYPQYVDDLASAPITALAARSVVQDIGDLEDLDGADVDLDNLRQRAMDEGRRMASMATKDT